MEKPIFRDFLSRFDSQGRLSCECGAVHAISTRHVVAEAGALQRGASLLARERGTAVTIWVLSDENTEHIAGAQWKARLKAGRVLSRILPAEPRPVPSVELVDELAGEVRAGSPDLLISVGSGVISDVVKKVSLETGVANWCVATAGSVDAFTSATASIHIGGFHNSVPARVSEAVICDLEVIEKAPREMVLAGLGDLLAKFIAQLDWNLSRIMTGEHFCPVISGYSMESAHAALSAARRLQGNRREAAATLTDAVLTSGFAMQAMGSSRPAASVEHTIAHLWEIADAVPVERLDLHGILVGVASWMVLGGYQAFYKSLAESRPETKQRLHIFDSEKPWQEIEPALQPFSEKVHTEMSTRKFDRQTLSERLQRFEASRRVILDLALPAVQELASGVEVLETLGFPFSPVQLGISTALCLLPCRNVRLLRSRYSTFDLAYELGMEDQIYNRIEQCVLAGYK
ncbi:MAG: iron-containing alcohol dehydrogenase [Spirochaetia bacterium]